MALDRSDDPLDPKRGWRISGRVEPTLLTGAGILPYLKVQTQVSGYIPFDSGGRTVLAGRLHMGSIINATTPDIPAPQRFFAGGGGSVRGFGYQEVGPRLADNTPKAASRWRRPRSNSATRCGAPGAWWRSWTPGRSAAPSSRASGISASAPASGSATTWASDPSGWTWRRPVTSRNGEAPIQIYVSIGQSF